MRKILITLGILIVFGIAILASWIFYGHQISLLLDRFGTIEVTSARINSIAYQGNGTGGIFHVNDVELSLNDSNGPAPSIGTTKNDQLALADRGKVFTFGPVRTEAENLATVPPAGDDCFDRNPSEYSELANAIRAQFHDRPFAIMETAFVLSNALEKVFRRELGNALALRAILLPRQRLGQRIHDTRRLDWSDPSRNEGVTAVPWLAKGLAQTATGIP